MGKLNFFSKLRKYVQQQQKPQSGSGTLQSESTTNGSNDGSVSTPRSAPKRRNSIKLILSPLTKALTKDRKKKSGNGDEYGYDDDDEAYSSTDVLDFGRLNVEQVLDMNNIVEMCRDTTDTNLIQYLSRRDVVMKLISYLVIDYTANNQLMTLDNPQHNKALNTAVQQFIASQDETDARAHGNSPRPPAEEFGSPRPFDYTGVVIAEHEDSTMLLKLRLKYPTLCSEILCSNLGHKYILPQIFDDKLFSSIMTSLSTSTEDASPSTPSQPVATSKDIQDLLFGFVNQEVLPLHLVRPFIQLMIHMIKVNSDITCKFMEFLYKHNNGHILKQFVKHVQCTDDICELLLLCLLYYQKNSDDDDYGIVITDGDDDLNEEEQQQLMVKYEIIEMLYKLITDVDYSENVSAILSTIVTLPPDSILYSYLINRKESVLNMVDKLLVLAQNKDVQAQSVCAEVVDFFCTLVLHSHSSDMSLKAIISKLPELSRLLVRETDDVHGAIDDTVAPPPLGILRLKLVELFVILFKHYLVLTGPIQFVRERRAREIMGDDFIPNIEPTFDTDLARMLCSSNVLSHCIYLFFRYHNHSILHNLVTHLITCLLENGLSPFISILLDEAQLIQRVLDAFDRNQQYLMRTSVTLGFMGHLSIVGACVDDHITISGSLEPEWLKFRSYLEKKQFLECEYRHGGSIPLPESFRTGSLAHVYSAEE
jgi:hypothetical protein